MDENNQTVSSASQQGRGINGDEVGEAISRFTQDPKWAKVFSEAPEGAKNRIALNFWVSCNNKKPDFDRGVYLSLREAIEKRLTFDDLQYLIATADKDALKAHYRQILTNLPEVMNAKSDADMNGTDMAKEGVQ